MKLRTAMCVVLLVLASCAHLVPPPTATEQAEADYGAEPTNYNHRTIDEILADTGIHPAIKAFFDRWLQGRRYIFVEVTDPVKGYIHNVIGGRVRYCWLVDVGINKIDRYGNYMGVERYTFAFRGDQVIDVITPY